MRKLTANLLRRWAAKLDPPRSFAWFRIDNSGTQPNVTYTYTAHMN